MKKNEKQVFKNAEMLNSFLLSKHFQFDSDDSAATLYKQSKNSFEKTIKNAIGLSNFISSFGQIISSKLLNEKELAEVKTRARKTKDVPTKKKSSNTISFELYSMPSKNQKGIVQAINEANPNGRSLGTNGTGNKASLDSGLKPSKEKKGNEDEDVMPSLEELVAKRNRQIALDKKRFSHKKISYKITEEEKLKKQNKIDVEKQTPQEIEDIGSNTSNSLENEADSQNNSSPMSVVDDSQNMGSEVSTSQKSSAMIETQDSQTTQSEDSNQSHDGSETSSQMSKDDQSLNPDHFQLEASPVNSQENDSDVTDTSVKSSHRSEDLEMDKNLHIDKNEHILDNEDGDFDENDPHEIQELDKEEARLKKLEKLGYPKVESIDLETKKPFNSFGLKTMSLTSSVKKFDGNPDASNAYKTLNVVLSKPFQEMKQEFQDSQDQVSEADPQEVEMVQPQPHLNTLGISMDEDDQNESRRLSRQRPQTYQQIKQKYVDQLNMRQPRNLRQMSYMPMPYIPLRSNYSDKDMFSRKSFLPKKELNRKSRGRPVARKLLQVSRSRRPVHHKNLKQKTDELYANMLKMRF